MSSEKNPYFKAWYFHKFEMGPYFRRLIFQTFYSFNMILDQVRGVPRNGLGERNRIFIARNLLVNDI